jgi:hypothetical protein
LDLVKKFIWDYLAFTNDNVDYDFLLALDGNDEKYLDFCKEYHIPLLYSEAREGVGLSKNRVLKQFPDYDYYFFIEDDAELVDNNVFDLFIKLSQELNFPHMSLNSPRDIIDANAFNNRLLLAKYGGGYFNFFSKQGLDLVGGWHTLFAKYRRYGHTEHTYRFYHQKLIPAPYIVVKESCKMVILHDPPHVTELEEVFNENQLINEEFELISQKSTYFPITTISSYYFNGFEMNNNMDVRMFLESNMRKYALSSGFERRNALAEHYFLRIGTTNSILEKLWFFIKSIFYFPFNNSFKHAVKTLIKMNK